MTADLLERARAAVTVEEECAVIWEAIQRAINEPGGRHPLSVIVGSVRAGHAPRPVLLGVVAELAPSPEWRVDCAASSATYAGRQVWSVTVALALLIAILEASNHG